MKKFVHRIEYVEEYYLGIVFENDLPMFSGRYPSYLEALEAIYKYSKDYLGFEIDFQILKI